MIGKRSRARRRWAPPAQSAHLALPDRPSLGQFAVGSTHGWSDDPQAHIAVYKPPCGAPGCDALAMIWQRCGVCREVFARCSDHVSPSGREVSEAREKHYHWQRRA